MQSEFDITVVRGEGNLYYSGGMRAAMERAIAVDCANYDYVLLMNDDVEFFQESIEKLIEQSKRQGDAVIIGSTQDKDGNLTYGGIKYEKGIRYRTLSTEEYEVEADTFNANCVLIPKNVFIATDIMDKRYVHSLGDFDYGLSIKRGGRSMFVSEGYVGICERNSIKGTWQDKTLSRKERLKKKKSPKGAPTRQWFYFLRKNFGFFTAIKGAISPYVRILLGK